MAIYNNYEQNKGLNTHRASSNDIRQSNNTLKPGSSNDNALLQTSTNIFIKANDAIVGMIQSFSVSENRTINKLQAIGYEGVVQAVPSNTNGGVLNVNRIALYESNMWNALGLTVDGTPYSPVGSKVHTGDNANRGNETYDSATDGLKRSSGLVFKTLKDQRVPLEIQVKTRKSGEGDDYYVETYVDCWLSSYSKSYTVQNITVAEQAQIQYADVY